MCLVLIPEQTETFTLYDINSVFLITVSECAYCAVRSESLYNTGYISYLTVK